MNSGNMSENKSSLSSRMNADRPDGSIRVSCSYRRILVGNKSFYGENRSSINAKNCCAVRKYCNNGRENSSDDSGREEVRTELKRNLMRLREIRDTYIMIYVG